VGKLVMQWNRAKENAGILNASRAAVDPTDTIAEKNRHKKPQKNHKSYLLSKAVTGIAPTPGDSFSIDAT